MLVCSGSTDGDERGILERGEPDRYGCTYLPAGRLQKEQLDEAGQLVQRYEPTSINAARVSFAGIGLVYLDE